MIKVDLSKANLKSDIKSFQEKVNLCHKQLSEKTGKGNDFLGWYDWPNDYCKKEFEEILKLSKTELKYDAVLVCGIGGSYLGTRAASEMIDGLYPKNKKELIYIGNTFSHTYISQVIDYISDKDVILVCISKSGTTTETAISFRIFEQLVCNKYKDEAYKRIICITDKEKGTLKKIATEKNYQTFTIPSNIGGRFSVFTPVGLVPLALAGVDVEQIMLGSQKAFIDLNDPNLETNEAYKYAVARRILNNQGLTAEMFVTYHLQLNMVAEWWKQLFGESEGKNGLGLLPTSACFSTDLHSLGQFVQDGNKTLYETLLDVENMPQDIVFPHLENDLDQMNYIGGKTVSYVGQQAKLGTLDAHFIDGNVSNIIIKLKDNSAFSFGYMIYFFFRACAMTCYLLDINPFDQPGVEVYKRNMFKLLGKK